MQILLIVFNQQDPGAKQQNAYDPPQGNGLYRVAEYAEMIQNEGGQHLASQQKGKHSSCPQLGGAHNGHSDQKSSAEPSQPDPPWAVAELCC